MKAATDGPDPDALDSARRQAQVRIFASVDAPLQSARLPALRNGGSADWTPAAEVTNITAASAVELREAAAEVLDGWRAQVRPKAP
ncbi:hypothetical protein [Streptomyces antibioticus]|uniref:hypothetical protein n=1 Tax=Streptomyces antibioticus TaxID=1890 RepID=UPI00341136AA